MKALRTMLVLVLLVLVLGISALADESQVERVVPNENNTIRVDLGDVERRPANLTADYDRDFDDLVQQVKQQNVVYERVINELTANNLDEKRSVQLEIQERKIRRKYSATST